MSIRNGLAAYRQASYLQSIYQPPVIRGGVDLGLDGGYRSHIFTTSGVLEVFRATEVEILVVAGGGGGGMDNGGAGGAGEVIHAKKQILSPGNYVVTIGAGGAGAPTTSGSSTGNPAGNGSDTIISGPLTFIALGGGGGASGQGTTISRRGGQDGGSSGGGQGENNAVYFIYPGLSYSYFKDYEVPYMFTAASGWDHRVFVQNSNLFDFGVDTDFTLELWVNQSSLTTVPAASSSVITTSNGTNQTYYELVINSISNGPSGVIFRSVDSGVSTDVLTSKGFYKDQWVHVAIVRSGSEFRLYLSGILVNTFTSSNTLVATGGGNITIGNAWEGLLKDFRITRGVARYSGQNVQVPTVMASDANTVLLTIREARAEEFSSYNHVVTTTDFIRSAPVSTSDTRYRGSPYSYDHNLVTYRKGIRNISGAYLRADAALSTLTSGATPWTIECFFKSETPITDGYLFGINTISSGSNIYLLGVDRFFDGTTYSYPSPIRPNNGVWYHFAATSDGTNIRCFVNGKLQTTVARKTTALSTCVLGIGAEFDSGNGGGPGNYAFGEWRNIRVVAGTALYTSNFTVPDINLDLEDISGTTLLTAIGDQIIDYSSSSTPINVIGSWAINEIMPVSTQKKCFMYDVGATGYYRSTDVFASLTNTTDPWTIEAFVQTNSDYVGGDTEHTIFGINAASTGDNIYWLAGYRTVWYNGSADQFYFIQNPRDRLNKVWTHVAYSFDGSDLRVFFNGRLVHHLPNIPPSVPLSQCILGVGVEFDNPNGGTPGNYYEGKIRDVRVSTECLYVDNFTAPDPITDTLESTASTVLLLFKDGSESDSSSAGTTVTRHSIGAEITDCLSYGYRYRNITDSNITRYGSMGGSATAADGGGGGGGGALFIGGNGAADLGGIGGAGVLLDFISGYSYWSGGGGAGNSNSGSTVVRPGGIGGGGAGGVTGQPGVQNTGGGGGGSRISIAGPSGGSGIVAIKYRVNSL